MSITIVVGGQYGSEGKGKVAYCLAKDKENDIYNIVRVGGPNSGHTVTLKDGWHYAFRMLPTACVLENKKCILAAGSYIDLSQLFHEIAISGINLDNLIIDPNAMIIAPQDVISEDGSDALKRISSTKTGTGAALCRRVNRISDNFLAKNIPSLKRYIKDTREYLFNQIHKGRNILIEGTQGFGLSVLHSDDYPYVTARDTTAAGMLSEVGLSPFHVSRIVVVLRSYPIRVAGHSGPLLNEISWGSIGQNPEYTSVTQKMRRVGIFDPILIKKALIANNPSDVVLNHVDYIPTNKREKFVQDISNSIDCYIDFIGIDNKSIIRNPYNY